MSHTSLQDDLSFVLDLQEQGIFLRAEQEDLVCDASPGAITKQIGDYIREHKTRLLSLLRSMESNGDLPKISPDPAHAYEPFPLTENQEAYWLGRNDQLEAGGVGVHVYFEMLFKDFDKPRFEKAWAEVVRSHAMLRAVLLPEGMQRVLKETPPVKIEEESLRDMPEEFVENTLQRARQEISHMQYTLFDWPQFRMKAFHLPHDGDAQPQSVLMASVDMWCLDLRSLQVILDHLADVYTGQQPQPIPAPSFRDYLITLPKLRQSAAYEKALAYWQERIKKLPSAPVVPLRPKAEAKTGHFTRRSRRFSKEKWQRIRSIIRSKGLTTSSVLLACYASTISRWSETKHFTLNIPRYNRLPLHEDIDDIVGEFASFSLLEVDNRARISFETLAHNIQQQMWSDLEFSHVSGVRVLRDWKKLLNAAPAVMAPYVFTSEPEHSVSTGNLRKKAPAPLKSLSWIGALERIGTVRHLVTQTPQVWLDSQFSEIRGDLYVSWDSLDGLFVEGLPERMFEAYCDLIAGLEHEAAWESPEVPLPKQEMDLRKILIGPKEALPGTTPWEALQQHAATRPKDTAIADAQGTLDWLEVANEVERWAVCLRGLGLGEGNAVAFALPKGRKQFIASMAIHAIGGIIIPLDHESPLARIKTILSDSKAATLLTDGRSTGRFAELPCPQVNMDEPHRLPPSISQPHKHERPLYCIIYTSGSTGVPKGVMVPVEGLLNMVQDAATRFNLGYQDRILSLNPIYHDFALFDIVGAALFGAMLVFPSPDRLKDPGHWLESMQRWGVTIWDTVPATMTMLLDYLDGSPQQHPILHSLRYAILGGDWIPLSTPNRLKKYAPEAIVVSIGGPTEVTVWNLLFPVKEFDTRWRSIPYGFPIRNAVYHILDDRLEDCPAMVVGEMYCSGAGLTAGYMNDAKKTAHAFFTHPVKKTLMFRTGDLGKLHENGYIEFIGRRDNQVNINGYRIELGEIETAMGRHPAVNQSVAVVCRRPGATEGLALWVVLKPGKQALVEELRAYLALHVPQYMFPSTIGIAAAFPLTQNNKIDRATIAGWPLPADERLQEDERPSTPTEQLLERVWKELLGVTDVFLDQNFFEIGGNSIAAVRLYNKVIAGKYTGLSVASIFSFPTIRSLAATLDNATPSASEHPGRPDDNAESRHLSERSKTEQEATVKSVVWPDVAPVPVRLPLVPATRVQQRMFYEEQRQHNTCYNLCLQVAVSGLDDEALTPSRIEDAFNAVIARQEILRTNFQEETAADNAYTRCVMQRIHPQRRLTLEIVKTDARQESLRQFCQEFTLRPYNLGNGPLIRLALVQDASSRGHLLIGFHHIILDGWSMTLLLRELAEALGGESLNAPHLQQADLGFWENSAAFKAAVDAKTPLAVQRIPEGGGSPSVIVDAVSLNARNLHEAVEECYVEEYIPRPIMDGIIHLAGKNGSTPFAIMCTAFGLLLADYNGTDTAQFGTYIAVRALPGLEDILGSMTCPAPLFMSFDRTRPLIYAARSTMDQLSESIDLSLLPFEDIVRAVAPRRSGDELPFFGVAFTFDNTPAQAMTAGGMAFHPQGMRQYHTSIDLEVSVSEDADGTRVMMVFNPRKMRLAPARDFMRRFIHLLAQATENPASPVGSLSPMTGEDRQLLQLHSMADRIVPRHENLLEYFYDVADEAPDFTAITETISTPSGPHASATCTLAELRLLADSMTCAMRDAGIEPGQRVGLLMPRGFRLVAAMLAAQQSGAVFIPLPLSLADERIKDILRISNAQLVCCIADSQQRATAFNTKTLALDTIRLLSPAEQKNFHSSGMGFMPNRDTAVCLFFTSGSEGRPKGVVLTHGNWINRLEGDWHMLPYGEGEVCMSKAVTGFIDVFCEIFQPLFKKIPLFVLPEGEEADVEALVDHMARWSISRGMIVVSLMQSILEVLQRQKTSLSALRHVMSSGERLPAGLVRAFYESLPNCTLHNYYGCTEVAADVVTCAIQNPDPAEKNLPRRIVPLGRPMPNIRVEIMSPTRTPLPHGIPGEVAIAGPSVTPGYLDGDQTRFFEYDGLRFFAPGDIAMWTNDGELLGFGRRDRQIKIRGQRVEPGDIEQVMRRHSAVAEVAVLAVNEESGTVLAACVVLHPGGTVDVLRRDLRLSLSGAMMPSYFVHVQGIPRTESGKVDSISLEKHIRGHLHDAASISDASSNAEQNFETNTEKALAAIWQALLGHPVPGRNADFFACGGHSLIAIRLVVHIREQFQVNLRVKDIFDTSVFAELAELVDLLSSHTARQLEPHAPVEVI